MEFRQLFYCQFEKNLCNLSFIVITTDIQKFCGRNSVTHNKNQNATSNVFDIHVKNSNVGLEKIYSERQKYGINSIKIKQNIFQKNVWTGQF
jgi:hypothetical protein